MHHGRDIVRHQIPDGVPQGVGKCRSLELIEQRGTVRADAGRDPIIHEASKQRFQFGAANADQSPQFGPELLIGVPP